MTKQDKFRPAVTKLRATRPGITNSEIYEILAGEGHDLSLSVVDRIVRTLPAEEPATVEAPDQPDPIIPRRIDPDDVGYEPHMRDGSEDEVARLRAENAALRTQMAWVGHADTEEGVSGGTMTINTSDWHVHDAKHLPTALMSCQRKVVEVIKRFRPRKLQVMHNGDIVPGRGIYRQQAMEAVLPKADMQVSAGAIRVMEFHREIADAAGMALDAIESRFTWGNHDYSEGEMTMDRLVYLLRLLGLGEAAKYVGQYTVWNIADEGYHNRLFFHGYGHSSISPSSNGLIQETLKLVLKLANDYGYNGEKKIRGVGHGHTHWFSMDTERAGDLPFDVTGGFQRFDRVNRGHNERPTGFIVYISPPGSSDVIPMGIRPDPEAVEQDMQSAVLQAINMREASRCLLEFQKEAEMRGIAPDFWERVRENAEAA